MSKVKHFFREKGVYLALLACIFAAAAASFWAIRSVVDQMKRQEEIEWKAPGQTVTKQAQDVPITPSPAPASTPAPTSAPASPSSQAAPSGAASSGPASGVPEPSGDVPAASTPQDDLPIWPVEGQVLQGYSGEELTYNRTLADWRTHNGMDITAPEGSRVVAAVSGPVTAVYQHAVLGGVVEQEGDGYVWRYCGLEEIRVKAGDTLEAGDTLGRLLTADGECGDESHLHLELLRDGALKDPADALPPAAG